MVGDIYGTRDLYDFRVSVHNDLTTAELRDLLESGTDFLHYIGHVDDHGIRCIDGMLDVETIEKSGVRGFFLNGCRSYEQGEKLVEKGSQVGVVTLTKVGNEPATEVGKELARLLNHGFGMQSALSVVTDVNAPNRQYMIIGDGSQELVDSKCGSPLIITCEEAKDGFLLELNPYPTAKSNIGPLRTINIGDIKTKVLNSTTVRQYVRREPLTEFLNADINPVKIKNEIFWPDEITIDDL